MPRVVAILPRDKLRKLNRVLMMDVIKLLLCYRNSKQIKKTLDSYQKRLHRPLVSVARGP